VRGGGLWLTRALTAGILGSNAPSPNPSREGRGIARVTSVNNMVDKESETPPRNDRGVISFRPVGPEDEGFLREVYASTRADELALVPWDAAQKEAFVRLQFAAQTEHYAKYYPTATHDIILFDDRPVGRLYVARLDEEIRIIDIVLLPQYRNAGIGTPIIQGLMAEAARAGKPLRIYVEMFNPSLRLFQRLGFSSISSVEEAGYRFLLEWRPAPERHLATGSQ
ncbi:MAG: GNAT family N-acetyltransferase, partial [Armatimonadota bacterium]|nr:GNAT family N-acetyltransferase [Armatimonadota bacterium]